MRKYCPTCLGSVEIPPQGHIVIAFAIADLRDVLSACEKAGWRISPLVLSKLRAALADGPKEKNKAIGKSEDAKRIKYLSRIKPIKFSAILDAAWGLSQSYNSQEESFRRAIDAARRAR